MDIKLSDDQLMAYNSISSFLETKRGAASAYVLTGAAGTGKTFLVNRLVEKASAIGYKVQIAATTHKAARVIREMHQGASDVSTIHSLLGLVPSFTNEGHEVLKQKNECNLEKGSFLICDEASMVSRDLLEHIGKAIKTFKVKILFVGDKFQLPPVGESESPVFGYKLKISELMEIQRQCEGSPIIREATKVRDYIESGCLGSFPEIVIDNETIHQIQNKSDLLEMVGEKDKIVAWTNRAVNSYNDMVRKHHGFPLDRFVQGEIVVTNSAVLSGDEILFGNDTELEVLRDGEKSSHEGVEGQQVFVYDKNNSGMKKSLFVPGDVAEVKDVLKVLKNKAIKLQQQIKKEKSMALETERRAAWRKFFITKEYFADLRPVHAQTVHKSQGSTYNNVFIDLADIRKNKDLKQRAQLLYVALTRATNKIYFI